MRSVLWVVLLSGLLATGTASAQVAQPASGKSAQTATKPAPKKERRVASNSVAGRAGLHGTDDPLNLKSAVAVVVDQDTDEVLFEKNQHMVVPIASITKLMTAMVTLDAELPLDEELVVSREDRTIDRMQSRLVPGVRLTRAQALQLALMASENHAAQLLGRTYPGGMAAFVEAMNAKAQLIGMNESHFVEPTGLSADNRASPLDLVRLVKAAYDYELIREYSVAHDLTLKLGKRLVKYGNTNRLTSSPDWEIGLQKTGYINAAGRCLVMQSVIEGQRVVMVLLDSVGRFSRFADAQRVRDWIASRRMGPLGDGASPLASAAGAVSSAALNATMNATLNATLNASLNATAAGGAQAAD